MSDLDRTPEDESAIRAMTNADGTMTKPFGIVYVQDSIIRFLEQESIGYRTMALDETVPETDRKDATLCADVADDTARALRLANTALLSSAQLVKPATVLPFGLPGRRH